MLSDVDQNLVGSASKLYRTLQCPASHWLAPDRAALNALIRAELYPHKTAGEFKAKLAEWEATTVHGTAGHTYLQFAVDSEADKSWVLNRIDKQHHEYLAKIDLTRVAGKYTSLYNREVALVYDVATDTAREVPMPDFGHREYGVLKDTEIPGTADAIIPGYRSLEVWDYKFGNKPVSPTDNVQLLQSALAVNRLMCVQATVFVLGIQQFDFDGVVKSTAWVVDKPVIDDYKEALSGVMEQARHVKEAVLNGQTPDTAPGDYCMFCESRPNCKSGRAHIKNHLWRKK